MINFNVNYHNVDLKTIKEKIDVNINKINEINDIFSNLTSLVIANQKKDLPNIKIIANSLIKKKEQVIIFGTGGSSLGARALINILQSNYKKKVIFFDNIDPIRFQNYILKYNIEKTGFIIISKSGYTPETLSQFSALLEVIKSRNDFKKLLSDFVIITENKQSPLKKIANQFGCQILDHNKNIGGRYSVFSNVGLLPASIAGVDIEKVRLGASAMISDVLDGSFKEHLIGANLIIDLQTSQFVNLNVLMTYSDALYYFGKWYLQLWAESIGKDRQGTTPIHSIGTIDQHSQLQLFLDGPRDKFFTLITKNHKNLGLQMNKNILQDNDLNYLAGKTMGDLMHAEQQATLNSLISNKLPVREIFCKKLDEFILGQLMAFFMMETIATCYFVGINPFNQPAVEQGKKLTIDYLSS